MRYRNGTAEKTKYPSLSQTEPINKIRLMSTIEILELSYRKFWQEEAQAMCAFPEGPLKQQ